MKLSHTEKEIAYDIAYILNLKKKKIQTNLFTKQKQTHRLMITSGEGRGRGMVRDFGIDRSTLPYLKWISNKNLLYRTGNSVQYYVTT